MAIRTTIVNLQNLPKYNQAMVRMSSAKSAFLHYLPIVQFHYTYANKSG
jgi:hypothetical protein